MRIVSILSVALAWSLALAMGASAGEAIADRTISSPAAGYLIKVAAREPVIPGLAAATITGRGEISTMDGNWIRVIRHPRAGHYRIRARNRIFYKAPRCLCQALDNASYGCLARHTGRGDNTITVDIVNIARGVSVNSGFDILCKERE